MESAPLGTTFVNMEKQIGYTIKNKKLPMDLSLLTPHQSTTAKEARKKGELVYKTRPFIRGIVKLMKTKSMKALERSQMKCAEDWTCMAIYSKLYSDLNSSYLHVHGKPIPDDIAAFSIHAIMTRKEYRTAAMGVLKSRVRHRDVHKRLGDAAKCFQPKSEKLTDMASPEEMPVNIACES